MSHGLDRFIKRKERKEQAAEEQAAEEQAAEEQVAKFDAQGTANRDWWAILQETVKSMILFPNQLAYTRKHILPKNKSITPEELATQLDIPLGVALVILDSLRTE